MPLRLAVALLVLAATETASAQVQDTQQEAAPATPPATTAPTQSSPVPLLAKWSASLYGFVEYDAINDSTESFADRPGNSIIARDTTYAGNHSRTMMSLRNTRLGFKLSAPEFAGMKASAVIEVDFLGNQPPGAGQVSGGVSESGFFTSPTLRLRHAYLKLENPIVDVLIGQYWGLFGWQPLSHPNTVEIQGVPGQVYVRTPQVRFSKTFKAAGDVDVEVAAAVLSPAQRDSGVPDGEAGARVLVNTWKGMHTAGSTGTSVDALSVGLSGLVRGFRMPVSSSNVTADNTVTGWGYSIDAFVPVIPATMENRGNGLTLTGSFVRGDGIADQYTSLNGGAPNVMIPGASSNSAFLSTAPNVDTGLIVVDTSGNLHAIQWRSFIVGAQYYLPLPASIWVAGNYSQMDSYNIASMAQAVGARSSSVFVQSRWTDFNVFWDVTPAVRLGAEYARFWQTYADDVTVFNNMWQFSAFYIF